MKVQYDYDGYPRLINFSVEESSNGFLCIPNTTKDIEKLNDIVSINSNKNVIENGLKTHIEDRTNLPIILDNSYKGDGYNLKIRMDILIREL